MSQAEDLLATLAEHTHPVVDDDPYFVIDVDSREITSSTRRHYLMQFDHDSKVFTFELPRYVEGHDMMLCNRAKVHYNNIDDDGNENADVYDVTDLHLEDDKVICSWTISRQATQLAGTLNFLVQYLCTVDGTPVYEWHTDIYSEVMVKPGRNNGEQSVIEYTDILEQWRAKLFGAGESVMTDINTLADEQLAAISVAAETEKANIEAKGAATLATIPSEYTELYNLANSAERTKADAIAIEVEGELIQVNDASDDYIRGLKVYGKTTQDGTPTLETPVELVSIENPTVNIHSKNLLALPQVIEKPVSGYNYDLFAGTSGQSVPIPAENVKLLPYVIAGKSYSFSCEMPELEFAAGVKVMAVNDDGTLGDADGTASATLLVNNGTFIPPKSSFVTIRVGTADAVSIRNIQLELGNTTTEYERGAEKQSLELSHALHAIPVTSGGNYTDENGQQWIADYVDFERGVYVQNVDSYILDGRSKLVVKNDEKSGSYLYYHKQDKPIKPVGGYCSHFTHVNKYPETVAGTFNVTKSHVILLAGMGVVSEDNATSSGPTEFNNWLYAQYEAGTPVVIAYALATPVETPLSETELEAFRTARSVYHNTTVLNDAGAHMSFKYNADTKIFLEETVPNPTDEQVQAAVDAWLTKHFSTAEGVSF